MSMYLVRWEMDIEADSAYEAAEKALAVQRDPESVAIMFEVARDDFEPIDLLFKENEQ